MNSNSKKFEEYVINAKREGIVDLPSIQVMSEELDISVPALREQIEALKTLGVLDARPRHGIRIMPTDFSVGLTRNAVLAASVDQQYFYQLSELRTQVEKTWFPQAAKLLREDDLDQLNALVTKALSMLDGNPIRIPHREHKELHLRIYHRLDNLYVKGILTTYWNVYEAIGMNLFTDLQYLNEVWKYHRMIVRTIEQKDYDHGQRLLSEHMELLYQR